MTKTKTVAPAMEGNVSRAIDFNLKKEDLMLLILEGRKENMEEEIEKLQTISTELQQKQHKLQKEYYDKMLKLAYKSLSTEAKKLAQGFGVKDSPEVKLEDVFKVELSHRAENISFTKYGCVPVGDGKGSAYIKTPRETSTSFNVYYHMKASVDISLHGKTFANKSDLFESTEVRACGEYSRPYIIIDQTLSLKFQVELPEYKSIMETIKKYNENESLLSDILAEYDLFNRNQPRAKAKMIKEVLSRDASGQALLGDIISAAKGMKLLA